MESLFESRFSEILRRHGGRRAIVHAGTGESRTFDAIAHEAELHLATMDRRALRGRIVLLREPNSPGWPALFLALHRAGAIVVPADPDTPDAALDAIARQLRAVGILAEGVLRKTGYRAAPKHAGLLLGKLTSGSTGLPKAHLFTEAQMIADGDAVCAAMGIGPEDLNHAGLPFGHSYALGNLILPLFTHGVPMVVATSHFPSVVAAEIHAYRATVFPTVPALIGALHRADIAANQLASLRRVISAGSRLAPEDARAFLDRFGVRVHNFYGSSETGGIAYDREGDATLRGDNVGTPMPGVSLAPRRDGRLRVSGPAVRTHGNRLRVGDHGAHPTGDLARIDGDSVVLEGRPEGLLKIGGRRVSTVEVERALRALDGVDDAMVDAIPGPGGEPRLAALHTGTADSKTVRDALRTTMPAWKIPSRLLRVERLPITGRGKPDRGALARLIEA